MYLNLNWLPEARADWRQLAEAARGQQPAEALVNFQQLANCQMDFVHAMRLDKAFQRYRREHDLSLLLPTLRVAVIGSSTLSHLHAGIRLGALRRGILVDLYEGMYGMYRQELMDQGSGLHSFHPDVLLIALDGHHLTEATHVSPKRIMATIKSCWKMADDGLGCAVIQQTILPTLPVLLGNQEYLYDASPAAIAAAVNTSLREEAPKANVALLAVDIWSAQDGISLWFDQSLWYRAKQEIHPRASNVYGEQVARILAALRGNSSKCLVLDLDNTLWGGVVGDDGVDGIVIGQGSEQGEAFLAFQRYAKRLSERGVILAVCSKNDEVNAFRAFDERAEMILKRSDVACFIADWNDKPANLRRIAERLKIGLNSLVFVDDNPFERNLVRRELPMVSVPELPEDPAYYVPCLAAAGYFESLAITEEDRERSREYRANRAREELRDQVTDMRGFLKALQMKLIWSPFDLKDIKRVVQLINKTNQFNLTTRRYSEPEVRALMVRANVSTLQLRLQDIYGNSGIIALLIGIQNTCGDLVIDTWLMSCRVLGRQVEQATLNLLEQQARKMHCSLIIGEYRPTASNQMVRRHYQRLGFELQETAEDGSTRWTYSLDRYSTLVEEIEILKEEEYGVSGNIQAAD